jgi:hypothetical protein
MCCCYMQYELYRGYATGVWACGTIARGEQPVTAISGFSLHHRLIAYRPALGRIVDAPGRLGVCFESALSQLWPSLGLGKRIKSCAARGVDAALGTNEAAAPAKRAALRQPWGSASSRRPSSRQQRTVPAKHA